MSQSSSSTAPTRQHSSSPTPPGPEFAPTNAFLNLFSHVYYPSFFPSFSRLLNLRDRKFPFLNHRFYKPFVLRHSSVGWQVQPLSPSTKLNSFVPGVALLEDPTTNRITADFALPPLDPEKVSWRVRGTTLSVTGTGKTWVQGPLRKQESGAFGREWRFDAFSRSILLPAGTKSEDVETWLGKGVLQVRYPGRNV